MATKWKIEFVNQKAAGEFDEFPVALKAKFEYISNLIQSYGPFQIGMPYVKHIQGKIWEIRLNSHLGAGRSLYVAETHQRIIILHSFIKKEQKTDKRAIQLALQRLKEIE